MIEIAANDNDECKFVDEIDGPCDEERVWLDADHPYCLAFMATVERYWGDHYRWTGVIPKGAPDRWRVVWRDFDTSLQDEIFDEYAAALLRKSELERNFRSAHWEDISAETFVEADRFWKGLSQWGSTC